MRKKGRFHQLDVTDTRSIDRFARFAEETLKRTDVLVNNAGVSLDDGYSGFDVPLETLTVTLQTNLYGPLILSQRLIPLMKMNDYGRIVNLSSGMGQLTSMGGGYPAYRISKAALNALSAVLARELSETNILVNSMCPGWVRTDMGGSHAPRSVEEGADTAVWLATLPDGGPTGGFFRDRRRIPW